MVPGDQSTDFLDFGVENVEKLEMAVEARFELMGERSKTSTFDPQDLIKHIKRLPTGFQAQNLRKSLEEIAVSSHRFLLSEYR